MEQWQAKKDVDLFTFCPYKIIQNFKIFEQESQAFLNWVKSGIPFRESFSFFRFVGGMPLLLYLFLKKTFLQRHSYRKSPGLQDFFHCFRSVS